MHRICGMRNTSVTVLAVNWHWAQMRRTCVMPSHAMKPVAGYADSKHMHGTFVTRKIQRCHLYLYIGIRSARAELMLFGLTRWHVYRNMNIRHACAELALCVIAWWQLSWYMPLAAHAQNFCYTKSRDGTYNGIWASVTHALNLRHGKYSDNNSKAILKFNENLLNSRCANKRDVTFVGIRTFKAHAPNLHYAKYSSDTSMCILTFESTTPNLRHAK